jgi:nitroreductase
MDAFECIVSKLDVREFSGEKVPEGVVVRVLEGARSTGSGSNTQHWHFILVRSTGDLSRLAESCPHGQWVGDTDFAVIVLTSSRWSFHSFDAGRAVQDMQLAAWNQGVASCLTTVFAEGSMRIEFNIPMEFSISAVIGFGYPRRKVLGRKKRKPLSEIVSLERYGNPFVRS